MVFLWTVEDFDHGGTGRSATVGISSDSGIWKQDALKVLSFKALEKKIQLTQLCGNAFFQHLVIAGYYYTIRPDEDDGWRTITLLCREYSSSRSYWKTKVLAAIPEGTTIGPVLEVHIVEILDGYGIEVAIQSFSNPENTSHVVIAREAERFVSEIHDHKQQSICLSWRGVESLTIHSFHSSVVTTDVVYLTLVIIILNIEATLDE